MASSTSKTSATMTIVSALVRRYAPCEPPRCKPATPKQTMIIAICFGVFIFLMFLMVLWWYRCFCCFPRKGDTRTAKQKIKDGFWGWQHQGRRPKKRLATDEEEADREDEDGVDKPHNREDDFEKPHKQKDWSWMLAFS